MTPTSIYTASEIVNADLLRVRKLRLVGVLRRTQNIPRTRSRKKMQMQLGQVSERTAGWESLARCTLGLHHTCKVWCWGADKGATECEGSMSD